MINQVTYLICQKISGKQQALDAILGGEILIQWASFKDLSLEIDLREVFFSH